MDNFFLQDGKSALHQVAHAGSYNAVKSLLDAGADIEARSAVRMHGACSGERN